MLNDDITFVPHCGFLINKALVYIYQFMCVFLPYHFHKLGSRVHLACVLISFLAFLEDDVLENISLYLFNARNGVPHGKCVVNTYLCF